MSRVRGSRAARKWPVAAIALIITITLAASSADQFSVGGGAGALPAGAERTAPEQRTGSATRPDQASGDTEATLGSPERRTARPAGAVPDHAAEHRPVAQPDADPKKHVTPAVTQRSDRPAIDQKAVERPQDRTANTETFDNPDGSRTLRVHAGQNSVRRPDGSWQQADQQLTKDPSGRYQPKAGPVAVSFAPTSGDAALVRLAFDATHAISYSMRDAADVPAKTAGVAAGYPGVRPGVDLRLTATNSGAKEELVLASPAAPNSYAFTVRTTGLEPKPNAAGGIDLVDAGTIVGTIPAGYLAESKIDQRSGLPARSNGVRYALDRVDASTWTLRVDLDTAWLRDPARVFPVTLDPSVDRFNADTDDTYVQTSHGTRDQSADPELAVGSYDGGSDIARAYLHFGNALNSLRNQYIVGATLDLDNIYSYSCQARPVTVFEVTEPWSGGLRFPGPAVGQALSTKAFAHGYDKDPACAAPGWEGLPLDPDLMTRWAHGTALQNGLSVRATDETDKLGWKRFASANTPNQPYLDVRYSPEGASYQVTDVLLPTNTRAGRLTAKVTNLGSSTWSQGGGSQFGYIVKQGDTVVRTANGWRADVAPMQTGVFDVPIDPLAPGDYQVYLTMFTADGQDFASVHGVPYGLMSLKVSNVAPTSNLQQPGAGATVESVTPTLYAEGMDPDNWPGKGLTYKFRVCTDAALTSGCQESDWTAQSWVPAPLSWSKTYYWGVKVYDTVDPTPFWVGAGQLSFTTRVPQPQITSHLAGSPDSAHGPGLDPGIGNYSTSATDVSVPTVGPDLTIARTYNSLDPRRDTAFGLGWASRLDMRLAEDGDGSGNVVVTYPSGRQTRFGRNPDKSFAPPVGVAADLVYDERTGVYTLRDTSGGQWAFDLRGRLVTITDPGGLTEHLDYTGDHATRITNDVSGRYLTLAWQGAHVATVQTQAPDANSQPLTWTYTNDGDRLTKVCQPGASPNCTTYNYTSGSHYRSTVLDDNPRAYWRFGETNGDTMVNVTARKDGADAGKQHGVVLGGAGALGGTADRAGTFDGNSSYVTLPDNLTTATMSLSAELWFKTTSHGTLLSYADQSFPTGSPSRSTPVLYVGTDGLLYGGFSLRDNGGPRQITGPQVNDGKWHHAVLSAAIDTQVLYLDGAAVGAQLKGFVDHRQQGKLTVGAGRTAGWPATNGGDFYFEGAIDEVALYLHPLGPLAAKQHFASGQAIDELTNIVLPQDNRQFAALTYDDANDRVRSLVDHQGRTWTMDPPTVQDSFRTAVLHGPSSYRDWGYTFDIDNGGRLVSQIHDGKARKYEYNTAGFASATVDELGHRVEQTTDARGNVLSKTTCRAKNSCNTSYFSYVSSANPLDPRRDKLASTSDARSAGPDDTTYRTTFDYDTAGRLLRTTSPTPAGLTAQPVATLGYATGGEDAVDGGKVPAGLLIRSTGRRGQVTSLAYRANGDLAELVSPTNLHVRYGYDVIGRQRTVTLANGGGTAFGTTSYEYTPLSQLAKVTGPAIANPITGLTHASVATYRYDGNGNTLETTVGDTLPATAGGDQARTTTMTYDAQDRLVGTSFPDGGKETRSYLDDGLTRSVTDVNGTAWTSQFDEDGRLLGRSAGGNGVDPQVPGSTSLALEFLGYDQAGRLATVKDAMGRQTTYAYYDDGLLASATRNGYQSPSGPRDVLLEQRSYDPAGNPTERITAGGRKTSQTFDAAGFLTSSTFDPSGLNRSTAYQRDADGNQTRVERRGAADPSRVEAANYTYGPTNLLLREDAFLDVSTALSTTVTRDERGLVQTATDRRQLTTSFGYDASGALQSTVHPPVDVWQGGVRTAGVARTETLGHNAFGETTQAMDGNGGVTATAYDSMGRVSSGTLPGYTPPGGQPITATTRVDYDHAGNAVKTTDPLGRVTVRTYDPYGRVLTTTLPQVGDSPSVLTYRFDRAGELASQVDQSGAETQSTYDELGRRLTSTSADRSSGSTVYYTTTATYDDAGDLLSTKSPLGAVSSRTYNVAGEAITSTDPTNRAVTTAYDIVGRPASVTDPTGLVTTTGYDLLGRQTRTAQSVGGKEQRASTIGYDSNGNVASTTSAQGRVTTYGYDALNHLAGQTEQVDANKSITTSFGYDKVGNRSRFVDGNGHATDYSYNSWGMPESVVEAATATAPNPADRTWTTSYAAAGQVALLVKPGGVTRSREYDAQSRLTVEHGSGAESATPDRTLGYDAVGRLNRAGGPGGDTTYRYDDRGNLLESKGPGGNATYGYNGDGMLTSRTDATGATTFGYDAAGRLSSVIDPLSGRTVDYGYDAAGRVATIADRAVAQRVGRNLSYDALGRLSSDQVQQVVDPSTPPRVLVGNDYGYDLDDKLTSKKTTGTAGVAANAYGYDGVGRLTSWTDGSGKVTTYGWDDAGNRTAEGGTTYSYDERNRLQSGGGAAYTYTARGTVASVTQNGATRKQSFDAFDRLTADGAAQYAYDALDRVATRNGSAFTYAGTSNQPVSDGVRLISRLPDGSALSDKAVSNTGKGKLLYADRHGDVVARYSSSFVDGQRGFDPFGKVTSSSGDASPLGYQGGWTDADTGSVNMSARWYAPSSGQFTSRDDWTLNQTPSAAGNRYAYGNNDPLGFVDPSGHNPLCSLAGHIIGGVAGSFLGPWGMIGGGLLGGAVGDVLCADPVAVDTQPRTGPSNDNGFDDTVPIGKCKYYANGCNWSHGDPTTGDDPPSDDTPVAPPIGPWVGPGHRAPRPSMQAPKPPPPPAWLINARTYLAPPREGTTVEPRLPDYRVDPSDDHVTNKNGEYTKEDTKVSEADRETHTDTSAPTNDTGSRPDDRCLVPRVGGCQFPDDGRDLVYFYTAQSHEDANRLRNGGAPWPTDPERAQFGPGVYSWDNQKDALTYQQGLRKRGIETEIVEFAIDRSSLNRLRQIHVSDMSPDEAEKFMDRHSSMWGAGEPHGYDYITRPTSSEKGYGAEHYFSAAAYPLLHFKLGG
ncbi:DNRLRE domain-containing protein [Solihabitans fulvus]|uniref:DNRLRE domain-containing protein n=1 Tax=Solihabitans fulvus TaxID=1892852 RepID=A0A5B2X5U1_9PSEU|nr:RHS repeat-associated core domain-containing protein [Solihabitans fulvus]KAA2258748.1 DNRLRE domain-containing protein [Solihabitans fulvus]